MLQRNLALEQLRSLREQIKRMERELKAIAGCNSDEVRPVGSITPVVSSSGASDWTRTDDTSEGPVDLSSVTSIEIHSDVWSTGYTLWVDGLTLGGQEITERNAADWAPYDSWGVSEADQVSDDSTDFKVGTASIKLVTDSGVVGIGTAFVY